jgi:hypothetical protein
MDLLYLIPIELKEILSLYTVEDISILDLKDSGLFNDVLNKPNFWKQVYALESLPIWNTTVYKLLNSSQLLTGNNFKLVVLNYEKIKRSEIDAIDKMKGNFNIEISTLKIDELLLELHEGELGDPVYEIIMDHNSLLLLNNRLGEIFPYHLKILWQSKQISRSLISITGDPHYPKLKIRPQNIEKYVRTILMYLSYHSIVGLF